jgi:hypothetical protein
MGDKYLKSLNVSPFKSLDAMIIKSIEISMIMTIID